VDAQRPTLGLIGLRERGGDMAKQSLWNRITRIFYGRPVTHAEQQAARIRPTRDPNSDAAMSMHNSRFNGLGNSR